MLRIAVLVSGGGTNLQALIDAERNGELCSGKLVLVVSSRSEAYGLVRAAENDIPHQVVERLECKDSEEFDRKLLDLFQAYDIDLVVLAGFLSVLGPKVVGAYKNRMLNVHPSLLPAFGGPGFYGIKVHAAVLESGVKVTGATVHFVNEITDGGEILLQKAVNVLEDDTPETLQKRVMEEAEWILLPKGVEQVCKKLQKKEGSK